MEYCSPNKEIPKGGGKHKSVVEKRGTCKGCDRENGDDGLNGLEEEGKKENKSGDLDLRRTKGRIMGSGGRPPNPRNRNNLKEKKTWRDQEKKKKQ